MLKTSRIIILALAGLAVLSILLTYYPELFGISREDHVAEEAEIIADENGDSQVVEKDAAPDPEEAVEQEEADDTEATEPAVNDEFIITGNPYQAYNEALEQGRPMMIEFYADW